MIQSPSDSNAVKLACIGSGETASTVRGSMVGTPLNRIAPSDEALDALANLRNIDASLLAGRNSLVSIARSVAVLLALFGGAFAAPCNAQGPQHMGTAPEVTQAGSLESPQSGSAEIDPASSSNPMIAYLQNKLAANPEHSDSWRTLGTLWKKEGRLTLAEQHYRKAIALDAENVAAHADLVELLLTTGRQEAARYEADIVFALGPQTEYAVEIRSQLGMTSSNGALVTSPGNGQQQPDLPVLTLPRSISGDETYVQQASLEVKAFDGSDELADELRRREAEVVHPSRRWRSYWEAALLYNSNISLTPISRGLDNSDAGGFQATLSPDVEFVALDRELHRSGPFFRGLFNLNESQHSDLNLGSFQPGWFGEWDACLGSWELTHRTEYVFASDLFAGDAIGNRNSLMFSTTAINSDLDVYYGYLLVSQSEFVDDGATPANTSLDGPAVNIGLSRFVPVENHRLTMLTFGGDLDWVETEGTDYRYQGGMIHSSATVLLSNAWELNFGGGVGYRRYADFVGAPSRDELVLRSSCRLRRSWTDRFHTDLVFGYDRFVSDNDQFDSERLQGGLATIWMY